MKRKAQTKRCFNLWAVKSLPTMLTKRIYLSNQYVIAFGLNKANIDRTRFCYSNRASTISRDQIIIGVPAPHYQIKELNRCCWWGKALHHSQTRRAPKLTPHLGHVFIKKMHKHLAHI